MRKLLLFIVACCLLLSAEAQPMFADDVWIKQEKHAYAARLAASCSNITQAYDIQYHRLHVNLDPAVQYISGSVFSRFVPHAAMNEMQFDMDSVLQVYSVLYHGMQVSHFSSAELLHINLPFSLTSGMADSIEVFYHGNPKRGEGFGSFVASTHGNDSVPIVWSLSEPYGAKDWWPCKQSLEDKIDSIDIIITCPLQYRAAANGLPTSEDSLGTLRTTHWKHRYPIATYLVGVAVSNYSIFETYAHFHDYNDSLLVLNYVYPEKLDDAKIGNLSTLAALHIYDSLFTPYPFKKEKYGQVQFGWGGGMEHQTASFVTNFGHDLLVHELAHQWFGDRVTCGSWRDLWLNEGFATYLNGLTYENMFDQYYWKPWKQNNIDRILKQPDGSVYVKDTTDIDRLFDGRLTYSKGAYLLHTLRWYIRDAAFFSGLRNYLNDTQLAYKFATTSQLKAHLEASSGKDLSDFFDQWFYGEGYPSYTFSYQQNDNGQVLASFAQSSSHTSVPLYTVPVPIRIWGHQLDTTLIITPTSNLMNLNFLLTTKIDSVKIDPELWIACKKKVVDLNSILKADDLVFISEPNPVTNMLPLNVVSNSVRSMQVLVYNAFGQLVYQEEKNISWGENNCDINCSNWNKGMYFLKAVSGSDEYSKKILKD